MGYAKKTPGSKCAARSGEASGTEPAAPAAVLTKGPAAYLTHKQKRQAHRSRHLESLTHLSLDELTDTYEAAKAAAYKRLGWEWKVPAKPALQPCNAAPPPPPPKPPNPPKLLPPPPAPR